MTDDESKEIFLQPISLSEGDVIMGVITTPEMIAAGAQRLRELLAENATPEQIAEEVHFAMRQAAGEGRPLRRVKRPNRTAE